MQMSKAHAISDSFLSFFASSYRTDYQDLPISKSFQTLNAKNHKASWFDSLECGSLIIEYANEMKQLKVEENDQSKVI